jgi:hypothetical protein
VTDDNGTVRLPQFIQAGMKAEPFTYMSRFEPSRDQMKPWNGHHSFTLTILSMKRSILNLHTTDMGAIDRTNEEDFIYTGPSNDGLIQTNTGQHLMIKLNEDNKQGYIGTFNIGLNAN